MYANQLLLTAALCAAGCAALAAHEPKSPGLPLIDQLDRFIQLRFANPAPLALGMSRVAGPNSMGQHFHPGTLSQTDFQPANDAERRVIADLEAGRVEAGLYVFGAAAATSEPPELNYRALKGPAVLTSGTLRPAWYPGFSKPAAPLPGALPGWAAIYPLARKAMRSFADGGRGFETAFETWNIAARPVIASQERCLGCHRETQPGRAVGGVLYAFRRSQR